MSTRLLIVVLLTAASLTRGGGSNSARVSLPTESLKLPDCYSGVPQVARFRLTNTGDQPLLLTLVPTGCDACVLRSLTSDRVPPGKTADVVLRFTPDGPMHAVALLKTNDPQRPMVRLTASVKSRPFAAIDPACVHVGALDAQARTSVIVHIRPASGVSVRGIQARSDGTCVQPHVEPFRDGAIPVKLTIQPRGQHGRLSERVTFIADLPGNPSISLQVLGEVR